MNQDKTYMIVFSNLLVSAFFVVVILVLTHMHRHHDYTSIQFQHINGFVLPSQGVTSGMECGVGQSPSKVEAQRIADSTGCPAYY